MKIIRKTFDKGYCLHPDATADICWGSIVRSHTIQRNGGLNQIARKGHVYTFLSERKSFDGQFAAPRLVGINQASTFTGFCKLHDDAIFRPIEYYPFQSIPEHTFLLAYRALCHNLFLKRMGAKFMPFYQRNLDRGKPLDEQIWIQEQLQALKEGFTAGSEWFSSYKKIYDEALNSHDFSGAHFYVLRLNGVPDFLCSAAFVPVYDFNGKTVQRNRRDKSDVPDHITFSLIATDTGGAIVLSWCGKSNAAEQVVRSLDALSDDEHPHAIVRFAFEFFENIFVSPSWWEGLDSLAQEKLIDRQLSGLPGETLETRDSDCLVDDGLRIVNWKILSRETNLIF